MRRNRRDGRLHVNKELERASNAAPPCAERERDETLGAKDGRHATHTRHAEELGVDGLGERAEAASQLLREQVGAGDGDGGATTDGSAIRLECVNINIKETHQDAVAGEVAAIIAHLDGERARRCTSRVAHDRARARPARVADDAADAAEQETQRLGGLLEAAAAHSERRAAAGDHSRGRDERDSGRRHGCVIDVRVEVLLAVLRELQPLGAER